jgi:hypothetical protein
MSDDYVPIDDDDTGDPPEPKEAPEDLTEEELAALKPMAEDPKTPSAEEVN